MTRSSTTEFCFSRTAVFWRDGNSEDRTLGRQRTRKWRCSARAYAPGYPEGQRFPDSISRIIDDERCQQFMAEGAHFESDYYLTLTYLPPVAREEKVKGWMFEGMKGKKGNASRILEQTKA